MILTYPGTQTTGWFAVGVSPKKQMKGSTVVICNSADSPAGLVSEWKLTGHVSPELDPSQDISSASCVSDATAGTLTLRFTRPFVSGDASDPSISSNGTTPMIWARGSSPSVSYHADGHRGVTSVDLKTGSAAEESIRPSKAMLAHGSLMLLAWGLFLPAGISVPLFFRNVYARRGSSSTRVCSPLVFS